ncbi:DUF551 domain-containing protein [Escherichia coli]|nr:DUF551 domain-containing protein [Escherichia coli]EFI1636209.1 DUF551 domain-containing protein [Escherichia coli]
MTTITKERLLTIKQWRETYGPGSNVVLPAEEAEELARIALASLEAKPIGAFHIAEQQVDGTSDYLKDGEWPIDNGIIEVYAAPPVPVVPEEKPMPNPLKMYAVDAVAAIAEVRGWNACRAAMLQGKSEQPQNAQQNIPENIPGGNSPVTPDGWIGCSERMPNDKQYVWCWGKSYGWTECDTFEGYYDWSRNKWWAVTDDGEEPASKVTHWMPLPEPPQEVK